MKYMVCLSLSRSSQSCPSFLGICLILCSLFAKELSAQNQHTKLRGTISTISHSKQMHMVINKKSHTFPINKGSFLFDSLIHEEGPVYIRTDSSYAIEMWIAPGTYQLALEEGNKSSATQGLYSLNSKLIKMPESARLYAQFNDRFKQIERNEKLAAQKIYAKTTLDSLLKINPASSLLPYLLMNGRFALTADEILSYLSKIKSPSTERSSAILKNISNDVNQMKAMQPGTPFENFTLLTTDNIPYSLSTDSSKLVLIEYWASDCYASRSGHGYLKKIYSKYHGKGFNIISITTDQSEKEWKEAIDIDGMSWINVRDPKGLNGELASKYYIHYTPAYIWLDAKHQVISTAMQEKDIIKVLEN